jgi:hypothetical protein
MHQLQNKPGRGTGWRQLVPHCSSLDCHNGSGLASLLHRASGFWVNETEWYCGERCLEHALAQLARPCFAQHSAPVRTTMPMGLMMLARGIISDRQLREALDLHHASGERIGACLLGLGYISPSDISSVIATQWGCPVFPGNSIRAACSMLIPFSLAERYRMLPVHLAAPGNRLFVGFSDRVNHSALIAVERMLECETEACVIPEQDFKHALGQRKLDTGSEVAVSRPASAFEVASMIRSYAIQTGANAIRMQTTEGNVWTRLLFRHSHLDLVFEHPPS